MKKFILCSACSLIAFGAFVPLIQATIDNPNLGEFYNLGSYYANTGQYDLAVKNYNTMVKNYPATVEAEQGWLRLGEAYKQLMLVAKADLDKAKKEGKLPEIIKDLESKVNSLMLQSINAFQKASAQFPASKAEGLIGISQVYAAFGADKSDEALGELQTVIAGYPEEAGRAQILVGDLYASLGDRENAKKAYTKAGNEFPEVASLATLRYADLLMKQEDFGKALDSYETIVNQLGIDDAYGNKFRFLGDVMSRAVSGRGEATRDIAEREKKKSESEEIAGYSGIASHYYGTNVGMEANMDLAEALFYYGRSPEAVVLLRKSIAEAYPQSRWAVRALMKLAKLQGVSQEAADTYKGIIQSYPLSIHWVKAHMKLADLYLKLAEAEKDSDQKVKLRAAAGEECKAVSAAFPMCPEGAQAKEYSAKNKL
ncbi:MAG: tetratricopeptide repeat protein [Candidatus Aureabacteria bacterium]|nr:tetratricopeptide repeat protein [Candidatus Auribacterota bacterium]